jgi:hypothetical protein
VRYYVFSTQAEAQAAVDAINARARTIYAANGYTVAADGSIIGKDGDGVDQPDSARTVTFSVPTQRLDGKWIVQHIEQSQQPNFVIDPATGVTVGVWCTQDLISPTIETDDGMWFAKAPW